MKKTGKIYGFLLTLLTVLVLSGCVAFAAKPTPTKLTRVGTATRTVEQGQEFELKVKMTPANANDDKLTWKISSGSGVIVFDDNDRHDDDIEFWAKKPGTAKVKCYVTGNSKVSVTFTVKVKKPTTAKSITRYGAASLTKNVGDEFELKVSKSRGLSDNDLTWTIADKSIVAFDDTDLYDDEVDFRALKAGKTKITCKIRNSTASSAKVTFTVTVKKGAGTITNRGSLTRTVRKGQEFDLEVIKSGVNDRQLTWSIANNSIVVFDDYEIHDDEMEFRARNVGKTTITCSITGTNTKVTFTVTVVAGNGGYYDDDDDDDWYDD